VFAVPFGRGRFQEVGSLVADVNLALRQDVLDRGEVRPQSPATRARFAYCVASVLPLLGIPTRRRSRNSSPHCAGFANRRPNKGVSRPLTPPRACVTVNDILHAGMTRFFHSAHRSPARMPSSPDPSRSELAAAGALADDYKRLRTEISKVIVGQADVVEQLLTSLFARGHVLLVGVPGLAKTLLVSTVAQILSLSFRRIQFTPDMMPSDITGTDILQDDPETGRRKFAFIHGPVFANIILADEINRTPPKTQAALLEAMQERHVTAGGRTYGLPDPFFVLATQNPIEQEGTYPLPEAQLDRFMMNVRVRYPSATEELEILRATTGDDQPELTVTLSGDQIVALQHLVRRVPVAEHVFVYARDLVRASRPNEVESTDFVRKYVSWGAGPRAGQSLILCAKARALLEGRIHASIADIRHVAPPVLRHRIVTTFHAEAEGIDADRVIEHLLAAIAAAPEKAAAKLVGIA
jgi:MoxR-like ATPase